jgi:hypothetical protein
MTKILLGTPIRQKKEVLKEFLISLKEFDISGIELDFIFIDDNIESSSSDILIDFKNNNPTNTIVISSDYEKNNQDYAYSETTHHWSVESTNKVGQLKNKIIKHALDNNYDYLFFVDSDLILPSPLLKHLVNRNVDIVSEVFWTVWESDRKILPQVWMFDNYNFISPNLDQNTSNDEIALKEKEFVDKMKNPNLYEVGGLGACTLISKKALQKGVSFELIKNISFIGEDRHFCIRASVLGLDLYADTCYPPLHLYRTYDLLKVPFYKKYWSEIDLNDNNYIEKFVENVFNFHFQEHNQNSLIDLINQNNFNLSNLILEGLLEVYRDNSIYKFLKSILLSKTEEYQKSIELVSKTLGSPEVSKSDVYFLIAQNFKLLGDLDLFENYINKSKSFGDLKLIPFINL